jgi:hypothetical protein
MINFKNLFLIEMLFDNWNSSKIDTHFGSRGAEALEGAKDMENCAS